MNTQSSSVRARVPWEVARWGRLLAGASALTFTLLGFTLDARFHLGTLLVGMNLVITSFTGRCALRDLLVRLGAREREDLYMPGGALRPEVLHELKRSASADTRTAIPNTTERSSR